MRVNHTLAVMIFRDCHSNIACPLAGCGCTSPCLSVSSSHVCAFAVRTYLLQWPTFLRRSGYELSNRGEGHCSEELVAMASFKGFDDDDEGPISNGLEPEWDENLEAKAIGIYKERRSAKVSQTGGRT